MKDQEWMTVKALAEALEAARRIILQYDKAVLIMASSASKEARFQAADVLRAGDDPKLVDQAIAAIRKAGPAP